jgi:signal transduction histidine kinase
VIRNFLTNAIKFTSSNLKNKLQQKKNALLSSTPSTGSLTGQITIHIMLVKSDNIDKVRVEVKDTGVGISKVNIILLNNNDCINLTIFYFFFIFFI